MTSGFFREHYSGFAEAAGIIGIYRVRYKLKSFSNILDLLVIAKKHQLSVNQCGTRIIVKYTK